MRQLFADFRIPPEQYLIKECMMEDADIQEEFDIVIAEGFRHMIDNGEEVLRQLCGLVRPGGVIVITVTDVFAMFVEQMKRLILQIVIKDVRDYEAQIQEGVRLYGRKMKRLQGMSRSVADWVKDDMLNPAFQSETILSMERAFMIFPQEFSILGSSQKIFTDYSWYKDVEHDERADALRQYKMKRHNFLFTDLQETMLSEEDSEFLERIISEIRIYSRKYEKEHSNVCLDEVMERLSAIKPIMAKIEKMCVNFVDDVMKILEMLKAGRTVDWERYETFDRAVGRTQQYLSMMRRKII